jgi:hypothetical protein
VDVLLDGDRHDTDERDPGSGPEDSSRSDAQIAQTE